ncbi:DUF3524 domain-containing protein, partial [Desulfobulbus sp. US1]|nr:DUF3524 domain-containing protein [Desulfobulbus sp. US1]
MLRWNTDLHLSRCGCAPQPLSCARDTYSRGHVFHENQFTYPGQQHDPGIFQFASVNFTSALCADRLAFNSRYNLETFLAGIRFYLKKS